MEGYGCGVWCISCWLDYRADGVRRGRLAANRGQEKQIQRAINQSSKKIKLVGVGQNVLIPIPQVDRRSPFDPQNIRELYEGHSTSFEPGVVASI